jgi:hypothetical protein
MKKKHRTKKNPIIKHPTSSNKSNQLYHIHNNLEFLGKFDALWLGPFIIKEVFPNNYVQLQNLDGSNFPTCTNGGCGKE